MRLVVVGDIGEERLAAGLDGVQGGRIGLLVGVLGDTEDAVLRVETQELATVGVDPEPRDVIAVEGHVVAVTESIGGQRHGEVGLARGAREAAADVPFLAGLLVLDAEQHELLGQELP